MTANVKTDSSNTIPIQAIDLTMGVTILPYMDWLYFQRMINPDPDGIVLPDRSREDCAWNELIAYGPGCKYMEPEFIGMIAKLPAIHNDLHRLGYIYEDNNGELVEPEEWCFRESVFIDIVGYLVKDTSQK